MLYNFEWDRNKAQTNRSKHKVGFEFAAEVFLDDLHMTIFDQEHSETEERWITMGKTKGGVLLVVVHTFTEHSDDEVTIRIISAREASNNERKYYEDYV